MSNNDTFWVPFLIHFLIRFILVGALVQLAACTAVPRMDAKPSAVDQHSSVALPVDKSEATAPGFAVWQHYPLPGKQATVFSAVRRDGRDAVEATADSSASMLRHRMRVAPDDLGKISFSWLVPALIQHANMALREADDSPVRIVLAFEGDRSLFSMKNAMLSELSHAITGEPLPYATLMYVWCNTRPAGSVIINPRTDRVRKMVVESGTSGLSRWLDYERNIRADFEQAFGEAPGALLGIAIMTDTDNTHSSTRAWYGQPQLTH